MISIINVALDTPETKQQQDTNNNNSLEYHTGLNQTTVINGVPVVIRNTMQRLAHDIIQHNNHSKYTAISCVSPPGEGKTSFITNLIHIIHLKHPNYNVHWFHKEDIKNMSKILESLPKRQDVILVWDDISNILESMNPREVSSILHKLTVVREILDARFKETKAINIMIFHYPKALQKQMRQSHFRIIVAMNDEERKIWADIMGPHNIGKIYNFINKYLSMVRYGYFSIPRPDGNGFYKYGSGKPFRIALTSNMGELHFTLYQKDVCCKLCIDPRREHLLNERKPINKNFWTAIIKTYGTNEVYNVLTKYVFMHTGRAIVDQKFRKVWRNIDAHYKAGNFEFDQIIDVLRDSKKLEDSDKHGKKEYALKRIEELQDLTIEQRQELEKKLTTIPDNNFKGTESDISLVIPTEAELNEFQDNKNNNEIKDIG